MSQRVIDQIIYSFSAVTGAAWVWLGENAAAIAATVTVLTFVLGRIDRRRKANKIIDVDIDDL